MAPRDEDQAAEPPAEGRAVNQFHETRRVRAALAAVSRLVKAQAIRRLIERWGVAPGQAAYASDAWRFTDAAAFLAWLASQA